jgi:RND family efflux transporter MFP subunit
MMNLRTRILAAAAGLVVIGLAVAWLSGIFEERIAPGTVAGGTETRSHAAAVVPVRLTTRDATEWASGTIASARRTAIASRVLARIEAVRVRAGVTVSVGDELVVLDAREAESRVKQAQESLGAARSQRDLAAKEKARIEALFGRGVATRQRLDQADSALRVAETETKRLAQGLSEAETALSHTVIRAPVAGRVVDRLADPGDTAVPGQPLLRIYDPTVLRVEVPVRESLAIRLSLGQPIGVSIPALGEAARGTIDEIVPFAEAGARTLLVKVRLAQDSRLFAGMYARAAIPAGQEHVLALPADTVQRIGQLEFAIVVRADGSRERRVITTGRALDARHVEVLSGLAEGENVLQSEKKDKTAP